jgi:hypothetical protein
VAGSSLPYRLSQSIKGKKSHDRARPVSMAAGLGVWQHRGKVAVAGIGHWPLDRRWDGVSMDKTLGAYSILACQRAMDEAGVTALFAATAISRAAAAGLRRSGRRRRGDVRAAGPAPVRPRVAGRRKGWVDGLGRLLAGNRGQLTRLLLM